MTLARTPLLGRESIVAAAWAALHPHAGVLLTGPEGIGRSAVLDQLAARAAAAGARVLRCAPTPADATAPWSALVDLVRPLPDDMLPRELRRAVRGPGDPADFAVHRELAALLAELSQDAPLVLAVDDLHHLDQASAAALAHLAHRTASLRLTLAATARTEPTQGFARSELVPAHALQIELQPLAEEFVRALLPEPNRRLVALAAGRPGHARALARHPAEATAELPAALRRRQLDAVRPLPPTTRQALLLAAHSAAPTLELLRAAGVADPVAALAPALAAGHATVAADGRVQLAHPVLAAALRDDADHARTLAAHEALAQAHPADTLHRARHLALARPWGDESLASALSLAAESARRRGDRESAADLAALAAARTPAAEHRSRHGRLLTAAARAADAARHGEARRAASTVLAESDDAARRVRARLVLLDTVGQALGDAGHLIEDGLADAGTDPALLGPLRFWSAVRELLGGRTGSAALEARRAAALAAAAQDGPTRVAALGLLGTLQGLRGQPRLAASALDLALQLTPRQPSASLLRRKALAELDADRVAEAAALSSRLLSRPGAGIGIEDRMATLVALTRVHARAGDAGPAREAAARCARLLTDAGTASPLAAYAEALAEAVGGDPAQAAALAAEAAAGSATDGDLLFRIRALGVLGDAQLLTGTAAGAALAVEALQQARELSAAMELADPDQVRRLTDLAEAELQLGEVPAAAAALREAESRCADWPADWGRSARAALDRATALLLAAEGGPAERVADLLAGAADALRELGLPLDLARTLLARGAVERRNRHRTAARALLAEAEQLCRERGAQPLLARVQAEQRRLDPGERNGEAVELTPSEARVARLVASGATNREVAAILFVSVKTVEGTLSRVYRKLGVRSRTALARWAETEDQAADSGGHDSFTRRARVNPLMGRAATS